MSDMKTLILPLSLLPVVPRGKKKRRTLLSGSKTWSNQFNQEAEFFNTDHHHGEQQKLKLF